MKWIIEEHDVLGSTQDALKAVASERPEGFAVQARRQEGGKGRQGRQWISPEGNLYLSVLLKPAKVEAVHVGQLSFVAALAVAKTVASYLKDGLMLKWPNDVLLAGKKCAGILLETDVKDGKVRWVAVGIGVNIASAPEIGSALQDHVKDKIDLVTFREELLTHLRDYYGLWLEEGFEPIRAAWLKIAHKPETRLSVKTDGVQIEGAFADIDGEGNLLIRESGRKIRKISAGDVIMAVG